MRTCRLCLATCLLMVATVSVATAEKIEYGDFTGADVEFSDVTEDSLTDGLPLFDEPTLAGASLVFNPTSFGAFSEGGGVNLTDASLTMTIRAINELGMRAINIVEAGDYALSGIGTGITRVIISAPVLVTIIEVDGFSIDPILISDRLEITLANGDISDGNFNLVDDENGAGISWQGRLTIDLDAALAENNISGAVTKVFFNMDNSLLAQSETGSLAFVKKKAASVGITPIIPEPSTFLLSVLGVVGLAGGLRRSRNRRVG